MVLLMATWHHTHAHTRLGGSRWNVFWHPPPGKARSSGQPAMWRPGTKCPVLSWSGTGLMSNCFFCMFLLLWGSMGGTRVNTGEHANSTQKGPEQAPTCCTMRDLNPQPSCCEATVLPTEPPCPAQPWRNKLITLLTNEMVPLNLTEDTNYLKTGIPHSIEFKQNIQKLHSAKIQHTQLKHFTLSLNSYTAIAPAYSASV